MLIQHLEEFFLVIWMIFNCILSKSFQNKCIQWKFYHGHAHNQIQDHHQIAWKNSSAFLLECLLKIIIFLPFYKFDLWVTFKNRLGVHKVIANRKTICYPTIFDCNCTSVEVFILLLQHFSDTLYLLKFCFSGPMEIFEREIE